ncbi:putative mannitol dehydrogenase [Senna tora]|uniref:Putative mannitol dehydrogenase n=1 Tax=Senna tora TaxID=362788 RepID=A0A834SSZ1_9FABA|nr:putative mannitol dehydrogenase [Senna tora]
MGLYTVIPAHTSGAAPSSGNVFGIVTAKCWSTTILSEYPPWVIDPSRSRALKVPGNNRIDGHAEVILEKMKIGVANSTVENLDGDIIITICSV